MKTSILFVLCCLAIQAAFADETNLVLMVDGETYSNCTFGAATPATVKIFHSAGITSLPLAKLPPELQKQLGYNPQKAAEYLQAQQKAQQAQLKAQDELLQFRRETSGKVLAGRQLVDEKQIRTVEGWLRETGLTLYKDRRQYTGSKIETAAYQASSIEIDSNPLQRRGGAGVSKLEPVMHFWQIVIAA